MKSRLQPAAASCSAKKKTKVDSSVEVLSLSNIAELIEDGEITIGRLRPVSLLPLMKT